MSEPHVWEDYDERKFVVLTTCKEMGVLRRLENEILQRIFPGNTWIDHLDDVRIVSNKDSSLSLALDVWEGLSADQRMRLLVYAEAFTDGAGV